jgi:hypothetical protein
MTDNVVVFPKAKKDTPPQSIEEVYSKAEATRKEHVEYVIDETLSFVFNRCYDEGFNLHQDHCVKSTAMVVEALRSALYNAVQIAHPLQNAAESMFHSEEEAMAQTENILNDDDEYE